MKVNLKIILLCFLLFSCGRKSQENIQNITLIYSISGGTRAHIISINSKNEVLYKVGSFYPSNNLDSSNLVYKEEYKEVKKRILNSDVKKIKECYLKKDGMLFNDTKIVKDSWEYYLYINGEKKAFGREFNFDDFPEEFKEIINNILRVTGKLHSISGAS